MNSYKIYTSIYDDEIKEGRVGLPRKWTHAKILHELVYDLLLLEQLEKHLTMLMRNDTTQWLRRLHCLDCNLYLQRQPRLRSSLRGISVASRGGNISEK